MSEDDLPDIPDPARAAKTLPFRRRDPFARGFRGGRPRIKKRRLLAIVLGLSLIALISTVFGMMMAVASDLPALENKKTGRNSVLFDDHGTPMGLLTGTDHRILLSQDQIPLIMKRAIISVEDRRFYTNSGVDIQGIGRAFFQDVVRRRAVQGASTIAQQFVKNALRAQSKRTLFQKLREAALAYHLTRRWSKDKILTQYLNAIYFGNGAYGLESAARTYFGEDPNHLGCGTPKRLCASELKPFEAALLAGIVASPTAYDPVSHPVRARARRDLVLADMRDQHFITPAEYAQFTTESLPVPSKIQPPQEKSSTPSALYFINWIRQQLVDRYGAQTVFEGGLSIHTTLDLPLQRAAEAAVSSHLSDPNGPTASLVAIDNATGEVRAMIGGRDFFKSPFNLAVQGQRQPGSAFKVFVLAQALREGISPDSVWPSHQRIFTVPYGGGEKFVVNNYEGNYTGSSTLTRATTYSDNSVYAAVGITAGVSKIADLARQMGIRTPVSHNYAITLGGLHEGVTPLDMAHAYQTLARGGLRVTGTLGSSDGAADRGPVGIQSVSELPRGRTERNVQITHRVLSSSLVSTENSILQTVVQNGTGVAANIGEFAAGKTGTTENYGDAWFVGFNSRLTVAVWVGYPDSLKSMRTDYNGKPVAGGTYPAEIWHDFMTQMIAIYQQRALDAAARRSGTTSTTGTTGTTSTSTPTTQTSAGSSGSGSTGRPRSSSPSSPSKQSGGSGSAPAAPAPAPSAPSPGSSQAPAPGRSTAPPSATGGTGAGTGGTGASP